MECIKEKDEDQQRRLLTPKLRNEIVRDLVTTMYAYMSKPDKDFCTLVAKRLVAKYNFMKDVGGGYVSSEVASIVCCYYNYPYSLLCRHLGRKN